MTRRPGDVYPFSAIVGQERLKSALLLCAVDPRIGGVLIRGEKGTAKSTAVRALAGVLPPIDVVEGCRYGCDPIEFADLCGECEDRRTAGRLPKAQRPPLLVDLPVSATEDRLVGTLDMERVLTEGVKAFEPGLLARANRGILYVDEINLLDDHLVDTLLDAAAMGVNIVEREGVSIRHPARFLLVGTMNPEEGDVRPQLLDRFGLCVDIEAVREPEARVEIVRRRHAYDEDPAGFLRKWADAEAEVTTRLSHARLLLPSVDLSEELLYSIASIALNAGVDGHRADQVMARAARAHAALDGRTTVAIEDVQAVAPMVLSHRLRRRPFDSTAHSPSDISQMVANTLATADDDAGAADSAPSPGEGQTALFEAQPSAAAEFGVAPITAEALVSELDRVRRSLSGRRQESVSGDRRGRYIRARDPLPGETPDIALDATIRTAAVKQAGRTTDGLAVTVRPEDVKHKVRHRRSGATIVFAVDASGSMGAAQRLEAAKSAVLELLVDAYQRRDRVGLVTFRGTEAQVVLAPTASTELAQVRLRDVPVGGSTPLAAGMLCALDLLEGELRRNAEVVPWMVLVTDGRGNVGLDGGLGSEDARAIAARLRSSAVNVLVLDTAGPGSGAARELARAADAEYVRLGATSADGIVESVRARLAGRS